MSSRPTPRVPLGAMATFLAMSARSKQNDPAVQTVAPTPAPENPRVQVYPSADGTVLLVGVTITGRWVAEYRCESEEFDESCVRAMEKRVLRKERKLGIMPRRTSSLALVTD